MNRAGGRRARLHQRNALALVAGLVVLVFQAGCVSPERRYRVLSFFFDGVLMPGEVAPEDPVTPLPSPAKKVARSRVRERPPLFVRHEAECDECHEKNRGRLRLSSLKQELCWNCHDSEDFEGAVVHDPVADGECTACHSPHKSQFGDLLLRKGSEICGECHDESTFPGLLAHQTAEGDDCLDCHSPHAADYEYLLFEEARAP